VAGADAPALRVVVLEIDSFAGTWSREPQAISAVLQILLRVIEAYLRQGNGASAQARFGAVSFIHRFGASLNRPVHSHCGVIDGVFEPVEEADDEPQAVRFRAAAELTAGAVAVIAEQVRIRVLRWFARSGLIDRDDVREMRAPRDPPAQQRLPSESARRRMRRLSLTRLFRDWPA